MDEGFTQPVPPGGYSWWYFDAVSDDGARAFTAIFFIGSVFSPSYAARLRRGETARAEEHLGVNCALYAGGRQVAWVMSEYGARALKRAEQGTLEIASSSIVTDGKSFTLSIRERSAPFMGSLAGVGARVRGTVEITPLSPAVEGLTLADADGRPHGWHVPVPRARFRVAFERPDFTFEGTGYHDVNRGAGRLEHAFSRWSWARFHAGARTVVLYATRDRAGGSRGLVVDARDGESSPRAAQPGSALFAPERAVGWGPDEGRGRRRRFMWGLRLPSSFGVDADRAFRCAPQSMLDVAPFYARYVGALSDESGPIATGIGEHLDLDRFSARGIQFLLRFKTRRVS